MVKLAQQDSPMGWGSSILQAVWARGPHWAFSANLSKSNRESPRREAAPCRWQTWQRWGKTESFGIASNQFCFRHCVAVRPSPRGAIRYPEHLGYVTASGSPKDFPGFLSPKIFRPRGAVQSRRAPPRLPRGRYAQFCEKFRNLFLPPSPAARGVSKVYGLAGRLPLWASRADFFLGAELLNSTPRNQRIKHDPPLLQRRVVSRVWARRATASPPRWRLKRPIYFPAPPLAGRPPKTSPRNSPRGGVGRTWMR